MNEDLLERAASAVRERYDGGSDRAALTEAHVLSAFDRKNRRRNRLPLVAIPLLAAMLATVAWGTVSGNLRARLRAIGGAHPTSKPLTAKASSASPLVSKQRLVGPAPEASTQQPMLAAPSLGRSRRTPVIAKSGPRQLLTASPSESEIDALYRAAHHEQFAGGTPAQALLLWDRYLAVAPNGSMSPEARYNRAIALARLGRKGEAATALEPFARGEYGGYRRTEAESLIEVLRPRPLP